MQPRLDTPFSRRSLLYILIVSAFYTLFALHFSEKYYRLGVAPFYDDIGYLNDASTRLASLYQHGAGGLLNSLAEQPPHSLWSTGAALTGFLLFGEHAWSAYFMNFLLVFLFLYCALSLARPRKWFETAGVILFILGAPMTCLAAVEFRPDFACNLFLASGSALLFFTPLEDNAHLSRRLKVVVCLLFSAALLAKPTAVLATLSLEIFALMLFVVQFPLSLTAILVRAKEIAIIALGFVIFSGWYYAIDLQHYYIYIKQNFNSSIHAQLYHISSLHDRLTFYLTGTGGIQLYWHYLLIGVVVVGAVAAAIALRDTRFMGAIARSLAWSLLAYAGTSLAGLANQFFGLNFQIMLMYLGAVALAFVLHALTMLPRGRIISAVGATVIGIAALSGFPPRLGRIPPPIAYEMRQINRDILDAISAHTSAARPARVVFLTVGLNTNPDTFQWLSREHNIPADYTSDMYSPSISNYKALLNSASVVVTSDLTVPELITHTGSSAVYPYVSFIPALQSYLETSKDFSLVTRLRTSSGGSYYIFAHR